MCSSPKPSFQCKVCNKDDRFDQSWVHHVTSIGHQRALTRLPKGGLGAWEEDDDVKRRAVELLNCQKLQAKPFDIAEYLTKVGGVIEEFICPTSINGTKPEVISCLFKEIADVDKILDQQEHKICRENVEIQLKYFGQVAVLDDSTEVTADGDEDSVMKEDNEEGSSVLPLIDDDSHSHSHKKPVTHHLVPKTIKGELPPVNEQLTDLQKLHKPDMRLAVTKNLRKILSTTFNSCGVLSYGTDFLGVCLDTDDMRLCIDPYGKLSDKSTVLIIRNPADVMACGLVFQILSTYKQPDGSPMFKFVSQYNTAAASSFLKVSEEIPEISFKQTINNVLIPCKLQFENFLSVQKSKILRFICKLDLRVFPLFSLIRLWSRKQQVFHEIREGEEFEGYILFMLMLFHITKTQLIPSVAMLRELGTSSLILENIECKFCTDLKKIPTNREAQMRDKYVFTLTVLASLKEFFEFFATFDFSENVVCPGMGISLEKSCFKQTKLLPQDMGKEYMIGADGSRREKKLDLYKPMVVQDLLDLTDNVARSVDQGELTNFQDSCKRTAKFLRKLLKKGQGDLGKYFDENIEEFGLNLFAESSSDDEEEPTTKEAEPPESNVSMSIASPIGSPEADHQSSPLSASPPSPPEILPNDARNFEVKLDEIPLPEGPPPLLPPPLPFQFPLPGMPSLRSLNVSSPDLKRKPKKPPPPPPKIGGLLFPRQSPLSPGDNGIGRQRKHSRSPRETEPVLIKRTCLDEEDEMNMPNHSNQRGPRNIFHQQFNNSSPRSTHSGTGSNSEDQWDAWEPKTSDSWEPKTSPSDSWEPKASPAQNSPLNRKGGSPLNRQRQGGSPLIRPSPSTPGRGQNFRDHDRGRGGRRGHGKRNGNQDSPNPNMMPLGRRSGSFGEHSPPPTKSSPSKPKEEVTRILRDPKGLPDEDQLAPIRRWDGTGYGTGGRGRGQRNNNNPNRF